MQAHDLEPCSSVILKPKTLMTHNQHEKDPNRWSFIEDLYPEATPEELRKMKFRMDRYIEVTLELYQSLRADPKRYAHFQKLLKEHRRRSRDQRVDQN